MANQEEFPRRAITTLMVPAELAILEAQRAVEAMAVDTRLTEAGQLLAQARDKVADYVDAIMAGELPKA